MCSGCSPLKLKLTRRNGALLAYIRNLLTHGKRHGLADAVTADAASPSWWLRLAQFK
jgi:hypothetical protein